MLDRKGKSLDLQEAWIAQDTVDIDAQRVCCQLGVQSGTQTPEGVRVVGLDSSRSFSSIATPISPVANWGLAKMRFFSYRQG
jgi:hypothetical protein